MRLFKYLALVAAALLVSTSSYTVGEGSWECLWGTNCGDGGSYDSGNDGVIDIDKSEVLLFTTLYNGAIVDDRCAVLTGVAIASLPCSNVSTQIPVTRDVIVTRFHLALTTYGTAPDDCDVSLCKNTSGTDGCGAALHTATLDGQTKIWRYESEIADYSTPGNALVDVSNDEVLVVHYEDAADCDGDQPDVFFWIYGVYQ